MKIFAFDIDHTLEISQWPVTFASIVELRNQGHIVGLCGNFAVVTMKEHMLANIKQYVPAEEYVMVGNVFGVSGGSDDQGAAERSGWRFVQERLFAEGAR